MGLSPSAHDVQAGLDRLIEAARNRVKLVPDDLIGDDRATVALVLGNIYNVLRQYDVAKGWFSLPLNGSLRSHSAGHRSFAGLGLARAVIGSGQAISSSKSSPQSSPLLQAKAICEASLAEYPKGSWHDETLYRLATVIQDMAGAKFGNSSKPAADGKKADQPARQHGPQSDLKAEREHLAALVNAKSEALLYWEEIIKRFPNSPRCEQALYYAGVLFYEMAEVEPGGKSEQLWNESVSMLKRFCDAYPKSPYAGDAYVRQIDIALERMFDPKAALGVSAAAGEWARWAIGAPTLDPPKSSAWALVVKYPDKSEIRRSVYDCLLRLGLVAYLAGDFDKAAEWVNIAGPKPPAAGFTANPDMESLTLYYLQKAIRSKKPVTDQRALDTAKTDEQRLLLQLGDLYLETIRPDKAEKVFLRIIEHDPKLGKVPVGLEGRAILDLTVALDRQPGRRYESLEWLDKLAGARFAGTYWGGYGLFRKALYTYNLKQNAATSFPLYQQFLRQYPDHPMRELANYYAIADACELKNETLAAQMAGDFRKRYPKSQWLDSITTRLSKLQAGAQKQGDGK